LLLSFNFCRICKADNPAVESSENGTQAIVRTCCNNPKCNKKDTWYSQPQIPGMKIPAGNFLLSISILLAKGSLLKVQQPRFSRCFHTWAGTVQGGGAMRAFCSPSHPHTFFHSKK